MAEGSSHRSRSESEEIATSTLAEIYAQQGLLGRALAIYRRMQARSPEDTTIAERIERLERRIDEAGVEPEAAAAGSAAAAPERERLPWDPPPIEPELPAAPELQAEPDLQAEPELPAAPELQAEPRLPAEADLRAEPAPWAEPAVEQVTASEAEATPELEAEPGSPPEPHPKPESPERVGPIDAVAFALWLEGR